MRTRLLATVLAAAMVPCAWPQEPPSFGAGITLVTVPVFVTDKGGKAVGGLAIGDFEVQDDGRLVKIVGFQEVDAWAPPVAQGTAAAPSVLGATRRQFLFLFDLSFTSPSGLLRSREAASHFIESGLAPSDLAAVATFSLQSGVRLLVSFTTDRLQLQQAVQNLGILALDRKADPLGLVYELPEPGKPQAGKDYREAGGRGDEFQEYVRQMQILYKSSEEAAYQRKVTQLLQGLQQLAAVLDTLQGRKQILYLSAGFRETTLVGEGGNEALKNAEAVVEGRTWEVNSDAKFGSSPLRDQMQRMLRAFASADCVVHTVDVTGLAAGGDVSQQVATDGGNAGRESLASIASGSGGRFVKDANNLGTALAEIAEASRRYYVFAFEPTALKGAGHFHKLKIRARGKVNVSFRAGYVERAPAQEEKPVIRRLAAAEVIAKGLSGGPLPLRALAFPFRNSAGQSSVAAVLEIDGFRLVDWTRKADSLGLEIYGYALDAKGSVEDSASIYTTLALDKVGDKLKASGLQCHLLFTVPSGEHSLRFLIREGSRGLFGARVVAVSVPPDQAGLVAYPPLVVDDRDAWVVVQTSSHATTVMDLPFRAGGDLYAPRPEPKLGNGLSSKLLLVVFDGRSDARGPFELDTQFLNASGAAVDFGPTQIKKLVRDGSSRRLLVTVTPSGVPPGDYTLKAVLRDASDGTEAPITQRLHVE